MSHSHYRPGERGAARRFGGFVVALSRTEYLLLGFDIRSAELKPQHGLFLDELIDRFGLRTTVPRAQFELIEGYTDSVDLNTEPDGNRGLRVRRANAVAQALIGRGAPARAIATVRNAPEGQFLQSNESPEGRLANRAVLLRFSEISGRPLPRLQEFEDSRRPGCSR